MCEVSKLYLSGHTFMQKHLNHLEKSTFRQKKKNILWENLLMYIVMD